MIKLSGIHVTKQEVSIEVSPSQLISKVIELYDRKYPRPFADCYINTKGVWMKYDYTHPHNGDDIYTPYREATPEEVEQDKVRKIINELTRK